MENMLTCLHSLQLWFCSHGIDAQTSGLADAAASIRNCIVLCIAAAVVIITKPPVLMLAMLSNEWSIIQRIGNGQPLVNTSLNKWVQAHLPQTHLT